MWAPLLFDAGRSGPDLDTARLAELLHGFGLHHAHTHPVAGIAHHADDVKVGILCDIGLFDLTGQDRTHELDGGALWAS